MVSYIRSKKRTVRYTWSRKRLARCYTPSRKRMARYTRSKKINKK